MESLKKYLIRCFKKMPTIDGMEKNSVILFTSAGIICGTPVGITDDVSNPADFLTETMKKLVKSYRDDNNISDEAFLDGNDGCVALKNVTIQNDQQKLNIPFLCVFIDQIVGVSIGSFD